MSGRMVQIEDFIGELTDIKNRWGNTCVYIRDLSWGAVALNRQSEGRRSNGQSLAARVLAMCQRRNWCLHWTARGVYLHLEASELIESVRGKGTSTPKEEAGDVLMVLMSITENEGIPWSDVIAAAEAKLAKLESLPPYQGEERMGGEAATKLRGSDGHDQQSIS